MIANVRETFHAPTGQGFRPTETAIHHRQKINQIVKRALEEAKIEVTFELIILYCTGF